MNTPMRTIVILLATLGVAAGVAPAANAECATTQLSGYQVTACDGTGGATGSYGTGSYGTGSSTDSYGTG